MMSKESLRENKVYEIPTLMICLSENDSFIATTSVI